MLGGRDHLARTRGDAHFRIWMVDDTRGHHPIRRGDHHSLRAGARTHRGRLGEEARSLLCEGRHQPHDLLVVRESHQTDRGVDVPHRNRYDPR